jgi:drug/metabolite transporter (DMT)-like permease
VVRFFNGVVLKELPPLTVVFLRVALAALILLPLLRIYRIGFPKGVSGWQPFFAIGVLNNVLPFSLIVLGQTYIPSGLASILNATTPLFTVVVMAAAGEEQLQARRIAGVIAGLIGVIILHGGDLQFATGQGSASYFASPPPSVMDCRRCWRGAFCPTRHRLEPRRFRCSLRPR